MASSLREVDRLPHHEQKETCDVRPMYRRGRKDTAVKVYTINLESTYLLIMGVPQVGANAELEAKCREFGDVVHFAAVDDYPVEDFTEVYMVRYQKLQSARIAKRRLDGSSFFGGILHVCFAPEFESVAETREKLIGRQKFVSIATKSGFSGPWNVSRFPHRPQATCTVSADAAGSAVGDDPAAGGSSEFTYIWAGKTYTMPAVAADQAGPSSHPEPPAAKPAQRMFVPRQALNSTKRVADEASRTIRDKLQALSAPNVAVTFKKRKL